jgi:flagellar biosynthesis protein FliQ
MYIWKTGSLATDIKNDNVESREWKKYYLALSIFFTLAMYLTALTPRENMVALLIEAIAMVGILIFGVSITYQSNKGDVGVDYISRMTALSFPITIKIFLVSLLGGLLVGILSEVISVSEAALEWVMVGFVSVIQIAFFWRVNIHMKYINA